MAWFCYKRFKLHKNYTCAFFYQNVSQQLLLLVENVGIEGLEQINSSNRNKFVTEKFTLFYALNNNSKYGCNDYLSLIGKFIKKNSKKIFFTSIDNIFMKYLSLNNTKNNGSGKYYPAVALHLLDRTIWLHWCS